MREKNFIAEDVLKKTASGDHNGFRAFYDATYPFTFRFTCHFLPDKKECEEVVSGVYCIIWNQKEHLPSIHDLKAWLYIVCRNEAYHFIKQKKKYAALSIDDLPVELAIDAGSTDGQLIEEEMLNSYNDAIASLPERCKLIFLMVREERLKHKEVARILSIRESTIEQQINIAIRKITEAVRKSYPEMKKQKKLNPPCLL